MMSPNCEGPAPHFVLVHGASHGSWCWYKLRLMLESAGYTVTCLDLAASGINPANADTISTFDEYNKPLVDCMASLPHNQKVILVGHSAGGLSLTQIIHSFPEKIKVAVFIAAIMLPYGFRTDQDRKDGLPDLSEYGDVYIYGYGSGADQPPTSVIVKKEFQRRLMYNMSPLEDMTLAGMLLRPCPIRAISNAKFPCEGGAWERVQRVYVKTLHDHTLKPEQQQVMINKWPPSNNIWPPSLQVYEIDSDHSAFFSNPSTLFGLLLKSC